MDVRRAVWSSVARALGVDVFAELVGEFRACPRPQQAVQQIARGVIARGSPRAGEVRRPYFISSANSYMASIAGGR